MQELTLDDNSNTCDKVETTFKTLIHVENDSIHYADTECSKQCVDGDNLVSYYKSLDPKQIEEDIELMKLAPQELINFGRQMGF